MKAKRLMAGQNRPRRGSTIPSQAIARFAQAILKRYAAPRGSSISAWRILNLVLRRARPGTTLLQVFRYHNLHSEVSNNHNFYYAPRMTLAVSQQGHGHGGALQRQWPTSQKEQTISRRYSPDGRLAAAKRMLSQLVTRCERVEEWPRAPRVDVRRSTPTKVGAETGLQSSASGDRPPARILRRVASREVEHDHAPHTLESRSEKQGVVARKRDVNQRPADIPLDISRLTDQVIQAIDRRIVARRERTGRL